MISKPWNSQKSWKIGRESMTSVDKSSESNYGQLKLFAFCHLKNSYFWHKIAKNLKKTLKSLYLLIFHEFFEALVNGLLSSFFRGKIETGFCCCVKEFGWTNFVTWVCSLSTTKALALFGMDEVKLGICLAVSRVSYNFRGLVQNCRGRQKLSVTWTTNFGALFQKCNSNQICFPKIRWKSESKCAKISILIQWTWI